MSDIIISARNLTKTYRAYAHPLDRLLGGFIPGRAKRCKEFHALNDVSFDIKRGETVGIIGRNGSGKSTLLQLICGIRKPTNGTLQVNGRISALLELGAGFHPEFTGRENVFLQGAIQGMSRQEMEARFDDIATFADIGEYIDQPVKTYSSGMFVRLAFAMAVSTEPDILVVDEALAVGDASFRAKCFKRIGELKNAGCTIFLVSHSIEQILQVTEQCLFLELGEVLSFGCSHRVVEHYQHFLNANLGGQMKIREGLLDAKAACKKLQLGTPWITMESPAGLVGDLDLTAVSPTPIKYQENGAVIEAVKLTDMSGCETNRLQMGITYQCGYTVSFLRSVQNVRYAILIKTLSGADLGGGKYPASVVQEELGVAQNSRVNAGFVFVNRLVPGYYQISVAVFGNQSGMEYALHGITGALTFQVVPGDGGSNLVAHINFEFEPVFQFLD